LKEVSASKLVVAVTHDLETAERYGDCVLTLSDGALVKTEERGTEKAVIAKPIAVGAEPKQKIPFRIAARYALKKAFARKFKLILSCLNLALAATLLFVGCDSAFFDGVSYIKKAIHEGDVATYRVGKYKDGESFSGYSELIANGTSLYSEASSYGAKLNVGCGFNSSSTGDLLFNFVDDASPTINGASYAVPAGQILVSDYVSKTLSLPVGEEVDYGSLKLAVSGVYPTDYASLSDTDADLALLKNDYCYCYVGSTDFVSAEAEQDIEISDFLAPFGETAASHLFYRPAASTDAYSYGRAPVAKDEIAVPSNYVSDCWPQGDTSKILGSTFQVPKNDDDSFGISSHLTSLTVVGIYSNSPYAPYVFLADLSFFKNLGDDFRLGAPNAFFFVDKTGACALAPAEADSSSGLCLTTEASENPAAAAHSASLGFRDMAKVALIASLVFLALALSAMLLYSLDNVKTNEKDVAILRLLGKKPSDIMWIFALMNLVPSLFALVGAYVAGPLLSAWIGATFAQAVGTTIAPPGLNPAAFFAVLAPLIAIPLLASFLSVLRIQKCEPSLIFKRNLQ
jgi:hypothetical protein